jgi:hypothetical protein
VASQDHEIADLARVFCGLIEKRGAMENSWLQDMALLLPRLQVAAESLGGVNGEICCVSSPDLDARFEIFSRLRRLLGANDSYWLEFDVAQDGQLMTGSLADDLTDIYCELKHGLRLWEQSPMLAIDSWREGYRCHWGQHLVDASRHLYELSTRHQL